MLNEALQMSILTHRHLFPSWAVLGAFAGERRSLDNDDFLAVRLSWNSLSIDTDDFLGRLIFDRVDRLFRLSNFLTLGSFEYSAARWSSIKVTWIIS